MSNIQKEESYDLKKSLTEETSPTRQKLKKKNFRTLMRN